jgi:hypothetical protein
VIVESLPIKPRIREWSALKDDVRPILPEKSLPSTKCGNFGAFNVELYKVNLR